MARLQEIVQELEDMELPLERNVALYKEGRLLAASCKKLLDNARNQVMLCDKDEISLFTLENTDNEDFS